MRAVNRTRRLLLGAVSAVVWAVVGLVHPLQAQEPAAAILPGQQVPVHLAAGEEIAYRVEIPRAGAYLFAVDAGDPAAFQVTVVDPEGRVTLADNLAEIVARYGESGFELQAGPHRVILSAPRGGSLTFALMGRVSSLSPDTNRPGRLYPGSIVTVERLDRGYVAWLDIPPGPYPRPVVVRAVSEEAAQSLSVVVQDRRVAYADLWVTADNEADRAAPAVATFWTAGGPFRVVVFPNSLLMGRPAAEAGPARVTVSLGPSPPVRAVGDAFQASLPAEMDLWVYPLELDAFYRQVTVTLAWEDPAVDLDLTVAEADPETLFDPATLVATQVYPGEWGVSRQRDTTQEEVTLEDLLPGRYLIVVGRAAGFHIPVAPLTLTITGEQGEPPMDLTVGEPRSGRLAAGEVRHFRFDGEVGQTFRVRVEGKDPNARLDLYIGLRPRAAPVTLPGLLDPVRGRPSWDESFVAPTAGTYYVTVRNLGEATAFRLVVESLGVLPNLRPNDVVHGMVEGETPASFVLPVEAPGSFLRALLVGEPGADLELSLELRDDRAAPQVLRSTEVPGPHQVISVAQAPAGHYLVSVQSSDGRPATFTLVTRLERPQALGEARLALVNEGGSPVCQVTATPVDIRGDPLALLEAPLEAGEAVTVTVPAGHYDLAEYDCAGQLQGERTDVTLQGTMRLTLPMSPARQAAITADTVAALREVGRLSLEGRIDDIEWVSGDSLLAVVASGRLHFYNNRLERIGPPQEIETVFVEFSPDDSTFYTVFQDPADELGIYTVAARPLDALGSPIWTAKLPTDAGVFDFALSPDGRWLAVADGNASVHVLDAATGAAKGTFKVPFQGIHAPLILAVAFSPDSNLLGALAYGDIFHVWRVSDGSDVIHGQESLFSSDGALLFAANDRFYVGGNTAVIEWRTDGEQVRRLTVDGIAEDMALSADARLLVVAAKAVFFFDRQTGQALHRVPGGASIALSADGTRLAVAQNEGPRYAVVILGVQP